MTLINVLSEQIINNTNNIINYYHNLRSNDKRRN